MSRYFFDIHDGFELRDEVGRELADFQEARMEAFKVISGLAAAEGEDSDGYTIVLNVRNEAGDNALTIRMVCQVNDRVRAPLNLAS